MTSSHRDPLRVTAREAAERTGHHPGGAAPAADGAGFAMLLDCREADEWRAGHAPGAVHVPLSALAAGVPLPPEARGRALVVVCRSGNRSRQAAELLVTRGFTAVDMIGGMRDRVRAGLPVVGARGGDGTVS
ncbi:rhodanese-like domain-containing protein [Streptomyces sp. NPDC020298]|uniref:rhodanese-like domain-containing protein n=1 Tax=unclassified Streptomyces TaxID=2593676 RepID=UPI0033C09266